MELTDFFACWNEFMEVKRGFKIYEVAMVKNVCDQSGGRTLKLKLIKYFWGSHGQKMGVASLVMGP